MSTINAITEAKKRTCTCRACNGLLPKSSKGTYTVHPLIHAWGRDRLSSEDRQKYCLMAYGMLTCSLPEDFNKQPYQFRRILVTHVRANLQHCIMTRKEMVDKYFDDAHEKLGKMLEEQGYNSDAEKF